MSFSIIAAIGQNHELGKKGGLCFHLPADLQFFKKTTMGHGMLMGYNTWVSLPGLLPGRTHYVLAPAEIPLPKEVTPVRDLDQFIKKWLPSPTELFVVGGGMVYRQLLPYADKIYLTEIAATDKQADTFFPDFDRSAYTRTILTEGKDHDLTFAHVLYQKK